MGWSTVRHRESRQNSCCVGGGVVVKLSFQKDSSVSIANYNDRCVNLEAVLVAKGCS